MNIRDLEYFSALAELLSFTQVAHKFSVSQPTVSYAVKRLEEHYGCDLIAREASHRSIALTNEGEILKAHVRYILDEFVTLDRAIEHAKNNRTHIGFPPIIRSKVFSKLLDDKEIIRFISNFIWFLEDQMSCFRNYYLGKSILACWAASIRWFIQISM